MEPEEITPYVEIRLNDDGYSLAIKIFTDRYNPTLGLRRPPLRFVVDAAMLRERISVTELSSQTVSLFGGAVTVNDVRRYSISIDLAGYEGFPMEQMPDCTSPYNHDAAILADAVKEYRQLTLIVHESISVNAVKSFNEIHFPGQHQSSSHHEVVIFRP